MSYYGGMSGDGAAARQQASEASHDAASARRDVADLQNQVDRLKLICAAMWELVKEKNSLTEDDLIARIAILDAKDGVADGKMSRGVRKCVKCQRTVAAKQNKCMYCGAIQPVESIFEGI